ncbi:uncharacterized protein LOC135475934 [Liolophura sinensis]|uniref:uncharacterized protein LOC135475934 n=1 Tax=Liolophura sinensis TaxID=3198878 RepID=UPI0031594638
MLLLLVCLSFVGVSFSYGEPCTHAVITRCSQMWGLDEDVITRRQLIYGRPMLNISQLLTFCSNPDRADISECQRDAIEGCDLGLSDEGNDLWNEMNDLLGLAVNFLCSKSSVLERDQACLDGISNRIVRCAQGAWVRFTQSVGESTTWGDRKKFMERAGRDRERCIFKVIKKRCNSEVANVYGNFLYGATVYPYDEQNQNGS